MVPIVTALKPAGSRGWQLYFRIALIRTASSRSWKFIGGHWQPFPEPLNEGGWDYKFGVMTLYRPDLTTVFSLFQVHWNFEVICTESQLTGKGNSTGGAVIWVMGTPPKPHHEEDPSSLRFKVLPPGSRNFRIRWLNTGKGVAAKGPGPFAFGAGRFEFEIIDDDRHLRATYNLDARVESFQVPDLPFAPTSTSTGEGPYQSFTTKVPVTLEDFQGDAVFKTEWGERTLILSGPSIGGHVDPIPIQTGEPKKGFDGKPVRALTSERGDSQGKFKLVGVSKVPR
jgi:hypothetical protein